jgi:hypothetical protein
MSINPITGDLAGWTMDGTQDSISIVDQTSGTPVSIDDSGQLHVVLRGKACPECSTTTPLLGGATFTGAIVDILNYSIITVSVFSNVASATNGLKIEQSMDGVNWDWDDVYTIPANTGKTFSVQPSAQYFRVRYVNGASAQSSFRLTVVLKKNNSLPTSHRIQDSIIEDDDAQLVKAVLTGKSPSGSFTNFQATTQGNFKVSLEELENNISVNNNKQLKITPYSSTGIELGTLSNPSTVAFPATQYDMFGKFMVASPTKLFEASACCPLDTTRYWDTAVVGSGTVTHNTTTKQYCLNLTTASGDKAVLQTRRQIQYNKGNAQEVLVIYKPASITNRRERWGYFDENNGVFFELTGTTGKVVIRTSTGGSPSDTLSFSQAQWDDPLNGSGPSGKTINWTKQTVFKIEFGWLSSRGVRFSIDVGGTFVAVKTWLISNMMDAPFMASANLPIRFEAENLALTTAGTSCTTCSAVMSSGASQQEGKVRVVTSGLSSLSLTTTPTIYLGVRLNSSYLNSAIKPLTTTLFTLTGTGVVYYQLIYNPTITGGSWTSQGVYDTIAAGVTTFSGGSVLADGYADLAVKSGTRNQSIMDLLSDVYVGRGIAGGQDALVLVASASTGTGTMYASMDIKTYS